MAKLNQILAVEKTLRATVNRTFTDLYHTLQKTALFQGFSRTYEPLDEDGITLPGETQRLQKKAHEILTEAGQEMGSLVNLVSTKDTTNTKAFADVYVGDELVAGHVPVTTLLFLEKQLIDWQTFLSKIPTLDPAQEWKYDDNAGVFRSAPVKTIRNKREKVPLVLYPATDKHPAQVQVTEIESPEGTWTVVNFSGALPVTVLRELQERANSLLKAVKEARERANLVEVENRTVGTAVFEYLLPPRP